MLNLSPPLTILPLLLFLLRSSQVVAVTTTACSTYYCDAAAAQNIRTTPINFPFYVPSNQSSRCGYPGFSLTCDQTNPFLTLPSSLSSTQSNGIVFAVEEINYDSQFLWVTDPEDCLASRLLDLNLTGSPFAANQAEYTYTFYNCSGFNKSTAGAIIDQYVDFFPVGCASGDHYGVGVSNGDEVVGVGSFLSSLRCRVLKTITGPLWVAYVGGGGDMGSGFGRQCLQLSWSTPDCGSCNGSCGFKSSSGLEVTCLTSSHSGFAKYGLILGVGVPGSVILGCLVVYAIGKVRHRNRRWGSRNVTTTDVSLSVLPTPVIFFGMGLDGATIESYPKTVLGESRRLPKPSDGTCAICLSEYVPQETLRTIPECNHFFHAKCIDEWLRMKGTCPVCRNSPEKSATRP
ncbi:hypothetical protein Droror1_Dr00019559 [Drosera rotundifolia]